MFRVRFSAFVALCIALAVAIGCGKKTEPTPDAVAVPQPQPEPSPTPADDAAEKAARAEAIKRLKQLGVAMHQFESGVQFLPGGLADTKGQPGLSWRVLILPNLGVEEAKLYEQFKLTEPWDSEHNKTLIAKMPKVFESPGKAAPEGKTYLRSFVGETAILPPPPPPAKTAPNPTQPGTPHFLLGRPSATIQDGSSNTLLVAEAAEPVEWTKPDELAFPGAPGAPNPPPVPKLGGPFAGGFHALMCDGTAHFFPSTLSEKTLRAMITVNGGEVLDKDATDILDAGRPKPPQTEIPSKGSNPGKGGAKGNGGGKIVEYDKKP